VFSLECFLVTMCLYSIECIPIRMWSLCLSEGRSTDRAVVPERPRRLEREAVTEAALH
jgi:hypothetical protein